MDPDVQQLVDNSGSLTAIRGVAEAPGRFASVRFEFERGSLSLTCDDDTDEIVAAIGLSTPTSDRAEAPLEVDALRGLLGATVEYAWELCNHRGYRDGFQLRFSGGVVGQATIQFECAASALDVLRVTRSLDS